MGCAVVDSHKLHIVCGKNYTTSFFPEDENGSPLSLSGRTGRCQIRDRDATAGNSTTVLLVTPTVTIVAPPLTGADLTAAQNAGADSTYYRVKVDLTGTQTNSSVTAINTAEYEGVYDIEAVLTADTNDIELCGRGPVQFYNDRTQI